MQRRRYLVRSQGDLRSGRKQLHSQRRGAICQIVLVVALVFLDLDVGGVLSAAAGCAIREPRCVVLVLRVPQILAFLLSARRFAQKLRGAIGLLPGAQ